MSERIRAIWETNDSIPVVWPETGSPVSVSATTLEKFAELIVKECANLNFRSTGFVCSEGEDMVRSMIKQHFGVDK